jgi:fused signal recognition particle receptor
MFDILKKHLSNSVKKLSEILEKKAEEPVEKSVEAKIPEEIKKPEEVSKPERFEEFKPKEIHRPAVKPEIKIEKEEEIAEKKPEKGKPPEKSFGLKIKERIFEREVSENDIDDFFSGIELEMMQDNVALEVMDFLKARMKDYLVKKQIKRAGIKDFVKESFEKALLEILEQGEIDVENVIRKAKSEDRPACFVFLGFNGSGKTTSIAKMAKILVSKKHKPIIAAADTFRAASIEQLEIHAEKLGVDLVKHKYGSDPAAVVFDGIKHAKAKRYDVVLADTAGRSHADKNLMDELKKVVRVNNPDLKILVLDSLTGNDAVEQARKFNDAVGVDCIILTKMDVNEKGGSTFSVCYAIKKPIIFIGTGQKYEDLEKFDPKKFVDGLID